MLESAAWRSNLVFALFYLREISFEHKDIGSLRPFLSLRKIFLVKVTSLILIRGLEEFPC